MRVLFVSPVVPWPPESGGRMRTYNLIRSLRGRAEVHLRAVFEAHQDDRSLDPLRPHCSSALGFPRGSPGTIRRWTRARIERWFHSPALEEHLAHEIASGGFDLVHLDELLLARSLPIDAQIPVVVHHHKLDTVLHEMLPGRSHLQKRFDVWKLHRLETEAARLYGQHIACSAGDARILLRRHPHLSVGVVESGFDPDFFRPSNPPIAREAARLLFLGSMNYEPNIDAIVYFVREILPLVRDRAPSATLEIVGAEPPREVLELASPSVKVEGLVADVRPYLERAAALVIPLRIGGGTRLKLVEAVAMGCPVVSTSVGAEGLGFENGAHLAIADRPREFADAVLEVVADRDRARTRAAAARRFADEHYRWTDLAGRLLELWKQAID